MVLQAGDELLHLLALEADLVDGGEQGKPAEERGHDSGLQDKRSSGNTANYRHSISRIII